MALLLGAMTFISTTLGGLFALKSKDRLHLILGFSAGAVMGVALFDLLPEAITLAQRNYSISTASSIIAVGFVLFMIVDRLAKMHHGESDDHSEAASGAFGAITLSLHSFLDGLGIGLAFKVSPAVGAIVAAAVLAHDFSDGINTVNYILKHRGAAKTAAKWLIVDALAPLVGVLSTYFFTLSEPVLGLVLAMFCGFFLYIGASELVPESHHEHPKFITTFMTILGMLVIYLAVHFAG